MALRQQRLPRMAQSFNCNILPLSGVTAHAGSRRPAAPHSRAYRLVMAISGMLAVLACVSMLATGPAHAADAVSSMTRKDYAVPAGRLSDSLAHFAALAGVSLSFDPVPMADLRSDGLQGSFTVQEGFTHLLRGSNYELVSTGDGTYSVRSSPTLSGEVQPRAGGSVLPVVTVKSERATSTSPYAGGQVARGGYLGILGNKDYMDTPFSITSYTAQTMQDQQARSVSDVVKNDPSVRTVWSDGSYVSQFLIRGFLVQGQDMAVNGIYGIVPPQLAGGLEMFERVEILKGPGALLHGIAPSGAVGGTVNLVAKRATDAPITQITGSYYSNAQFGTHVDIGRRFGEDNKFGIRLNGAFRGGETAIDDQKQRVGILSLGLDYRSTTVRVSTDLGYQNMNVDAPSRPVFTDTTGGIFQIPRAPKGTSNLGQSWYFAKSQDIFGMARAEVDVTPWLTAYVVGGARQNEFLGLYNFVDLQNANGGARARQFFQPNYSDTWTIQGGLTGKLKTGLVQHALNLSATTLEIEAGNLNQTLPNYQLNIYDPIAIAKPGLGAFRSSAPRISETTLTSFALADTMSIYDDRLQFIAGLRQQIVKVNNFSSATGARTSMYDESAITPAFAVIMRPWENFSLYANYIEGLSQGPTAPITAANAGNVFAPIKSKQYEVGVKFDFGRLGATVAYFEIRQPTGYVDPTTNTFGMDGEQRNRGVELNTFGVVARGLRVLGGVTFMDGVLTKTAGGTNDGNRAIGVPKAQLNVGTEWDLPFVHGLTLTGRYIYTSSQVYNVTNTQSIPSWDRFDVSMRYRTRFQGRPMAFRAAVENVFDKDYWAGTSAFYGLARGFPRVFLLSATMNF